MALPDPYQRILTEEGTRLDGINPGSDEIALPRDAALRAIRALEGTCIAILGGDVMTQEGGHLRYAYAFWHCDRRSDESDAAFAERSRQESTSYIERYPTPSHGLAVFVSGLSE